MNEPAFLPFALPDFDEREVEAVAGVIRSGWLTTGPITREFESRFAEAVGSRFAVAVNSCTAALHLSLEGIGLQAGERVVTTPYTFAATAEVVEYFGATPVFVDVESGSLNLNPERLEAALQGGARAIILVHFAGEPCDLLEISRLAKKYGVPVIEDAAHALPSKFLGETIGHHSTATCFSFYATKTLVTGEGGMLCTDDEALADRARVMSLHGITRDAWKRYTEAGSWFYEIDAPGFKYNMTDMAAALGLVQLEKLDVMWQRRKAIASAYDSAFSEIPELQIPHHDPRNQHAWHLYVLRLQLGRLSIDRAQFIEELKARRIGASVHFIPLHIHPYYRKKYGYSPTDFPVASEEYQRALSLPIYSKMNDGDIERVIHAVKDIVATHRR